MIDNDDNDIEVKCIFCGKDLDDRNEMVRYRGAISCRECAEKQPSSTPILKPFFYLGGIGCLIGMLMATYFTFHVYLLSNVDPEAYIQPVVTFYVGLASAVSFMSLGLYAINRVHLFAASVVSVITGILVSVSSALAVYDFVIYGPYYTIESVTFTKTIHYYSFPLMLYILFSVVMGLAILLHMSNIRTEYVSIASAGLFFLSAGVTMALSWIVTGFFNVFVYAITFGFFMTRRKVYEEAPIQPV